MLGEKIIDNVESKRGEVKGIGLLPAKTIFAREKRTNHLKAEVLWEPARGMRVEGYEIRFGRSTTRRPFSVIKWVNGRRVEEFEGAVGERTFGTYLHGIFHNFEFTEAFLNLIRREKGLEPIKIREWSIEDEINRFAKIVRESIDVDYIIEFLGL